jgi:hypothetical protein
VLKGRKRREKKTKELSEENIFRVKRAFLCQINLILEEAAKKK